MASDKELADFLAGVERRAFKQTVYAVRDDDANGIHGLLERASFDARQEVGEFLV